jgi:sorbitol/mannitol transport system substrate-binding protein
MSPKNALRASSAFALCVFATAASAQDTTITVATVNNGDMIRMQGYTDQFTAETGIGVEWVTLEENVLRQRVTTDITTKGGQFDIMTIGMYETPIWGANGWLVPLDDLSDDYDVDDILPAMRGGLSHDGTLYAAPFYGESSMVMYRTDLMEQAGLEMPEAPTWAFIREAAAAMTDRDNDINGICLRGKAGWGEGGAFITVTGNSFGARWFDEDWNAQFDQPEWAAALNFFVDMMNEYGPPGYATNGFNENLSLFQQGKCGHVDRRHRCGLLRDQPGRIDRRRPCRLCARPRHGAWQAGQLAVGLGAGDPGGHPEGGRRQGSSSNGPPRRITSSWWPKTKAGPMCRRARAPRFTRRRNIRKSRSRR